MATGPDLAWQGSLFDTGEITYDAEFRRCARRQLADGAWVDHQPGWLGGADELFATLLRDTPWGQHSRWMYERKVIEPRLTHRWHLDADPGHAALPAVLEGMAGALSARYGVEFSQVGVNLYRDGSDSVAWHGDRIARELPEATVALVSLGAPRPFKLRPKGGGRSVTYLPGPGDLLVMGGSCQRTWDHAVPKVAASGPRISIQFRHAYPR
ncbi:MAG: alpha-ketoglutarate-dependent dioxygenase AlkB [Actinomycetota bacterium]|nr:alpha-ketoglutarate-dependent dioxygenase AlkB [Actinomycetota bacterium]